MKKISILGSTGSIGRQAVEVIDFHQNKFNCYGLAAYSNLDLLQEQVLKLKPSIVAVVEEEAAKQADEIFKEEKTKVVSGEEGLYELASNPEVDLVLNAIVGAAGLRSTIAVISSGKDLALANKESMVVGGEIIAKLLQKSETTLIPVDSEHSAIFQCLLAGNKKEVRRLVITGSGGPFRGKSLKEMEKVTVEEALKHPRWKMGPKITIDSATLANKGLEYIEAHYLFDIDYDQIEIVIHPQSCIHSLVEFEDGSLIAHMGQTDMRIPIQYAFTYPKRMPSFLSSLDLSEIGSLTFEKPDYDNFPCLSLCKEAAHKGQSYPAVFNATNEEAVKYFLNKEIRFTDIPIMIDKMLEKHIPIDVESIDVLVEVDRETREISKQLKNNLFN